MDEMLELFRNLREDEEESSRYNIFKKNMNSAKCAYCISTRNINKRRASKNLREYNYSVWNRSSYREED